ncbi:AAA family ATPase [Pedobacter nanyangensis]|uniref:AAA family ATPase n=1 Tax=Pedobacter nanyangensis TaxID=1562389 RepID=UPI000DE2CE19|nr:zeta toxin family protein [Pedobacter nanyangensis]
MRPLQLYVLCGPNGAGKSTLSETFVPPSTDIFDGDREMALLRHQYPMTDSGTLYEAANGIIFDKRKENAITSGSDFAFETNFRTAQVMESVRQFRDAGYETRMIFIGLPSIEASIDRVNMRVKAGGHFVDAENVNKNFTGGLENLVRFYDGFDSVDLLESTIDQNEPFKVAALMTIKNGVVVARAEKLPEWAMKIPK